MIGWFTDYMKAAAATAATLIRKPGTPAPVPPAQRAINATEALNGPRLYYNLGAGGRHGRIAGEYVPHKNESPSSIAARRKRGAVYTDCSGAVAGVLGLHRRIKGYARGWDYFSTDGVIRDANDPAVELVRWVELGEAVLPWTAIAVYGSTDLDGDGDRDIIGHMGLVSGVKPGWVYRGPPSLVELDVWHAASSSSPTGALRISDGRPWRKHGRLLAIL